jgi:hypothetical protein
MTVGFSRVVALHHRPPTLYPEFLESWSLCL